MNPCDGYAADCDREGVSTYEARIRRRLHRYHLCPECAKAARSAGISLTEIEFRVKVA